MENNLEMSVVAYTAAAAALDVIRAVEERRVLTEIEKNALIEQTIFFINNFTIESIIELMSKRK